MKRILLSALAVVMSASVVYAQSGGYIGLYSDVTYCSCNLSMEVPFANYNVYVVHSLAASARASQFELVPDIVGAPLSLSAVDFGSNPTLGDLFTGITVYYAGCKALPWLVATITWFYYGTSAPKCTYGMRVEADSGAASGYVESLDCSSVTQIASGGYLSFWGDPSECPCSTCLPSCAAGGESCVVATEQTSWSRIKSLYH